MIDLSDIDKYYSNKLIQFGTTPNGVDWKNKDSQFLRFEQLCKAFPNTKNFSVNDLGCGYGALYEHIINNNYECKYHGFDISDVMIAKAKQLYSSQNNCKFYTGDHISIISDCSIASGVFNVKLDHSDDDWRNHMLATLTHMNDVSRLSFSFNCLTNYSDKHLMKDYLYYANPTDIFDFCKMNFSKNVALLHDYDLYEFTIIVRKNQSIENIL